MGKKGLQKTRHGENIPKKYHRKSKISINFFCLGGSERLVEKLAGNGKNITKRFLFVPIEKESPTEKNLEVIHRKQRGY